MQLPDADKAVPSAKYFPPLSNNNQLHATTDSISPVVMHLILRTLKASIWYHNAESILEHACFVKME